MKFRSLFGLVATALVFPVYAQDPAPPAPASQAPAAKPTPNNSAVSEALGKKDTDVDQAAGPTQGICIDSGKTID